MTSRESSTSLAAAQLPQPKVLEAEGNGDVLDLTKHLGNFTITVDKWAKPLISLFVRGRNESGGLINLDKYYREEISPAQFKNGLNETIDRTELMKLGHLTPLEVTGILNLDGSTNFAHTREFDLLSLTIKTNDLSLDDLTNFNNETLGGWQKGIAGRELAFIRDSAKGGFYLLNNTSDQSSGHAGVILEKTFPAIPGSDYEFTIDARNQNSGTPRRAKLVLSIDNKSSSEFPIDDTAWKSYSFVATATSNRITVRLENRQAAWDGNDFCIDNLRVRSQL